MDPNTAAEFLGVWGYPSFLVLLLATGFGSPLPEDVLLLLGGYLVSADVFAWRLALPFALAGVVGSDVILYMAGRHVFSQALRSRWMGFLIRPARLRYAMRWFSRFGDRTIFLSRLIPGTRTIVFIAAGMRGVPLGRFLVYDVLGAVIWVPLLLFAGSQVGEELGGLTQTLGWLKTFAILAVLAMCVVLIARWLWRSNYQVFQP
jgi:membrane protein DedA with SNARE-associated domain